MTEKTDAPTPLAPRTRTARRTRIALIAGLLALTALGAACSDSDSDDAGSLAAGDTVEHGSHEQPDDADLGGDSDDRGDDDADTGTSDRPAGVPKECSIYPFAMEAADPDEITMAPAGWPAPPPGATLCVTSTTIGGSTEVAEYALGAEPETILGYYEAQLGDEFNLAREAGIGAGDILTGYDDETGFQVSTRDGGFKVVFSEL